MFSLSHILIGLGMVAAGVALTKYSFQIMNFTGQQDWIDRIAGPGNTNGVYKLFGVVLVLAGLLFATGFGNNLMDFIFSPLRRIFTPPSA